MMKSNTTLRFLLVSAFCGFFSLASVHAERVIYKIDPVHSGVNFRIRHFINNVPGTFSRFEGEIHFDKSDPTNSKAVATIDLTSVDTRNSNRDEHLQQDDYFHTAEFPRMTFESTRWEVVDESNFKVTGNLSFLGRTNEVVLDVVFLGEMEGRGIIRSGWEGRTTIDRTQWGLTSGTPAVGRDVHIELNIQGHLVQGD